MIRCGYCSKEIDGVGYQLTSESPISSSIVCESCGSMPRFQVHILCTYFTQDIYEEAQAI